MVKHFYNKVHTALVVARVINSHLNHEIKYCKEISLPVYTNTRTEKLLKLK